MVYTANWGIIYHLPPIKGTRFHSIEIWILQNLIFVVTFGTYTELYRRCFGSIFTFRKGHPQPQFHMLNFSLPFRIDVRINGEPSQVDGRRDLGNIQEKATVILLPMGSMGQFIFTYIYHKIQPNVGKYTIHGWYGFWNIELGYHPFYQKKARNFVIQLERTSGWWLRLAVSSIQ